MDSREIRVMPDWLKNQIAAGEVVERPASVVKELVENSLDAGARRVVVEVVDGGLTSIRVVDDGCGMGPEDARRSLLRHATSKLYGPDDLLAIGTLGFRGEALPSIASISRFTLATRRAADQSGLRLHCEGAGPLTEEVAGLAPGTEVLVVDLFFNTPARRKFMKSPRAEAGRVAEILEELALGHPAVHFLLLSDGRKVLEAPASADPLGRLWAVLGAEVCNNLFECRLEGPVAVRGFISQPDFHRSTRGLVHLFVNGRPVKDRTMMAAVTGAYGPRLPKGRFPVAVLDVLLPTDQVDVNVHPAKSEVRFQNSGAVFGALSRALTLTLEEAPWSALGTKAQRPAPPRSPQTPVTPNSSLPFRAPQARELPGEAFAMAPSSPTRGVFDEALPALTEVPAGSVLEAILEPAAERYLGAFADCYLIFSAPEGVLFVDQHAAHEGLLFQDLLEGWGAGGVRKQGLLVPLTLAFTPAEVRVLVEYSAHLRRAGIELEDFGGGSVLISALPPDFSVGALKATLQEAAAALEGLPVLPGKELLPRQRQMLATMACKGAVKAGDRIAPAEARRLLELLRKRGVKHCPHGRPVLRSLSLEDLERWFKRAQ
jgi:DNA mismatch repair protein MutL